MRPLDPLSSIKIKLGVVILAAVLVTIVVVAVGVRVGVPLAVGGVAAAALALGMVQFLARGMTSPLREMAAAAQAMAKGDYDRRVTATSRDEVGELARAFNKMASELAEVDRMRRDLVANVSHELRTPITALQAVLENLVDGVEPATPDTFEAMLRQVHRLGRLVSQLLDLSKLESGAVPLQRSSFRVRPLVEQVVQDMRLHSGSRAEASINLSVDVNPADLTMDADPERIHQVLANLVDNAVRHSPRGGRVVVRAGESNAGVALEVADDGPGIPREEATRVFERFYRSDLARSNSDGGSGLGLAIARWIVDLHGGDIRVEPGSPGGCRMVVVVPRRAA
jgi:signal transduction histidine kinase